MWFSLVKNGNNLYGLKIYNTSFRNSWISMKTIIIHLISINMIIIKTVLLIFDWLGLKIVHVQQIKSVVYHILHLWICFTFKDRKKKHDRSICVGFLIMMIFIIISFVQMMMLRHKTVTKSSLIILNHRHARTIKHPRRRDPHEDKFIRTIKRFSSKFLVLSLAINHEHRPW